MAGERVDPEAQSEPESRPRLCRAPPFRRALGDGELVCERGISQCQMCIVACSKILLNTSHPLIPL